MFKQISIFDQNFFQILFQEFTFCAKNLLKIEMLVQICKFRSKMIIWSKIKISTKILKDWPLNSLS